MTRHEYEMSKVIATADPPFYSLIMAAMREADSQNARLLREAFPATWFELQARYDAPGGVLEGD